MNKHHLSFYEHLRHRGVEKKISRALRYNKKVEREGGGGWGPPWDNFFFAERIFFWISGEAGNFWRFGDLFWSIFFIKSMIWEVKFEFLAPAAR